MSSSIVEKLSKLNINASNVFIHAKADSMTDWKSAVAKSAPSHQNFQMTKTLLLKPKAANKSTPAPAAVMVVALECTEVSLSVLAKFLAFKEFRFASEDTLTGTFGATKHSIGPFSLLRFTNDEAKATIKIVLDQAVVSCTSPLLFRADSDEKSALLSAEELISLVKTTNISCQRVDFAKLAAETPTNKQKNPQTVNTEKKTPSKPAAEQNSLPTTQQQADGAGTKEVKVGMTVGKEEDFPSWYQQVLTKSEMMDYYDVSGCYILRPWSFNIWKAIQEFFEREITEMGVEPAYFPMFVSRKALEREKDHVEGFAPEVAWVTKAGDADLAEPIAVRPTSETVMYPAFAKWVKSHRDLPLRLNQWCNVVRWEFKNPQPFLRTREFLWQEGHTAFATKTEADAEVREILDLYSQVYQDLLAVPVIQGVKSEKEKFAGGLYTTTCEAFIPTTGRAIQGATSHCLGQNFSKMFDIMVENEHKERIHVWQNSWGLTTRTIGVMVMVHGDDRGLVLPPRVAATQVIIVPCGLTVSTSKEEESAVYARVAEVLKTLKSAGIRAKSDIRDIYTPGWKFNHWELKGVPIRLEIGPKDIKKNEARAVRRDNGEKAQLSMNGLSPTVSSLLQTIQSDMLAKASKIRDERLKYVTNWDDFVPALDGKNMVLIPWCEAVKCEEGIKKNSVRQDVAVDEKAPAMGAKSLCIPFSQPGDRPITSETKCVGCGGAAKRWTLFGRSY